MAKTQNVAVAQAAPAPAAQSTKPGEPAPKAKKEKVKRILHPALKPNAEGKPTEKLDGFPADFDPKVHKPLRRVNFKNEAPLLLQQADKLEAKAKALRAEAEACQKLGSQEERAKAKKLRDMFLRMEEIKSQLAGEGVDVAALMNSITGATEGEKSAS